MDHVPIVPRRSGRPSYRASAARCQSRGSMRLRRVSGTVRSDTLPRCRGIRGDRLTCTNCGSPNDPGARFCAECGTPLSAACRVCGAGLAPTAKFCSQCGTRVGDDGASTATTPATGTGLGAERRLVSVLFADLVGFTTLAEGRDAELVRDLLTRYFERRAEIIRRYGGTVEKFIGDAVMAVWGAPVAHEDDAERAVRAALDLVASVADVGRADGLELVARAGVLTGEAAVTLGRRRPGHGRRRPREHRSAAAVGRPARDGARRASPRERPRARRSRSSRRASSVAQGQGRARARVAGAARRRASAAARGRCRRAGGAVRRPRRRSSAPAQGRCSTRPPASGARGSSSIIGRGGHRQEPARLGVQQVHRRHRRDDVLARGPLARRTARASRSGRSARWSASARGLAENDDEATTRERVAAIARRARRRTRRSGAGSSRALLALLGLGEPPAGGRERALRRAGARSSSASPSEDPVVLVFEDLHWADDGPARLHRPPARLDARAARSCVVTLARPELLERRPDWGAGRRNFAALSPRAAPRRRRCASCSTGLVPGPARGRRRGRSSSAPTASRCTRSRRSGCSLADGRLEPVEDGVYRARRRPARPRVPETLHALIAARLDALAAGRPRAAPGRRRARPDASRSTASRPSRAGASAELEPRLRALVAARAPRPRHATPGRRSAASTAFVQALIREVAYATLAKRDRRARHLAAARYFESLGDDELAGALATHYLAAYRARRRARRPTRSPPRRGSRCAPPGSERHPCGSPMQAIAVLDVSAGVARSGAGPLELVQRAGAIAEEAGRHEQAVGLFERAITGWQALGDRTRAARAGAAAADAALLLGRDRVRAILDRAFVDFGAPDPRRSRVARAASDRGSVAARAFQPRASIDLIEEIPARGRAPRRPALRAPLLRDVRARPPRAGPTDPLAADPRGCPPSRDGARRDGPCGARAGSTSPSFGWRMTPRSPTS